MATISFETTMTIDNEEQMKVILDAIDEAESMGPLPIMTPEETAARLKSDEEKVLEMFSN